MACLSILGERGPKTVATVAANPIFPLDALNVRGGELFRFEVFDADAGQLKALVGTHRCFYIDETSGVFWARFQSLEPCVSTHPGLGLLRDKPTLRGVLVVVEEGAMRQ